ncbi:cryptochrome/photolyase family protein [Noviherbaspirillum aridicola]|uniref:Deoxyribodipyrimidine photo-lyase n=1 Tax=Noviherbaspirillum aridicola TaxID=2849687 RepID=A0ABQ4Q1M4_9BURK|nr:deoxyribodipyrimidine photo-lyase [Noviherbaspirillum aridicola]GIZ51009.1 deoxyribodipyrimidine photo-lyase [Noviherbaspirillum aridicola]
MDRFGKSLVWFRRDLRDVDHAALHHALARSGEVCCVFIFDKLILDPLPRDDRRVEFIHDSAAELDAALRAAGGGLIVLHGDPVEEIPALAARLGAEAVLANHDYEPYAVQRDVRVAAALERDGRAWLSFKDQVIFEKNEVMTRGGTPFSVFTPYKKAWLAALHAGGDDDSVQPWVTSGLPGRLAPPPAGDMPSLEALGFSRTNLASLPLGTGMSGGARLLERFVERLGDYQRLRDYPAASGTSLLSVHLRFGTVSVRSLARLALQAMRSGQGADGGATWLSELIWRDFYFMILHWHPRVVSEAFRPEYDRIEWETGEQADRLFAAWCEGRTGYPLVDAAMLQLRRTGFMHNRLRMVTASFLVKDLGIDWRRGERYFAQQLNDFDLSANNGGWQWAASSGCDAQPYFRIFNPVTQSERFDPQGGFIRHFLPQLGRLSDKHLHAPWLAPRSALDAAGIVIGRDYPAPVVDHDEARRRTLARYAVVRKSGARDDSDEQE